MRLADKVAIVTGAAAGIGEATAIRFAEEGAKVTVCDIDVAGGENTVKQITDAGGTAQFIECDVRSEDAIKNVVAKTLEAYGKINILFNNAGIMWFNSVEEETLENWDNVYAINTRPMFLMSKYVWPELKKQGGGSIINMGSVTAYKTSSAVAAYASCKGANAALTQTMALDGAPFNIRVNTIVPGTIDTPILRRYIATMDDPDAIFKALERNHPLQRVGTPREVANMVLFLASDEASFCTGAAYRVDGGFVISGEIPAED